MAASCVCLSMHADFCSVCEGHVQAAFSHVAGKRVYTHECQVSCKGQQRHGLPAQAPQKDLVGQALQRLQQVRQAETDQMP
jgi:hypothetical protein